MTVVRDIRRWKQIALLVFKLLTLVRLACGVLAADPNKMSTIDENRSDRVNAREILPSSKSLIRLLSLSLYTATLTCTPETNVNCAVSLPYVPSHMYAPEWSATRVTMHVLTTDDFVTSRYNEETQHRGVPHCAVECCIDAAV